MAQREETRLHPIFEEGKLVAERFQISKHIGQGGYGDIYSALDTKTGHPCAVKVEYLDAEKQALLEEIRIMIKPEVISDDRMPVVAREIVQKIESEMEYPGQIKVNLIRETRSVDFAK